MKIVPEMTKELEAQLTRKIRAFERVTGMQVSTIHLAIIGIPRAMSKASVSLQVDERPIPETVPELEYDPLDYKDV